MNINKCLATEFGKQMSQVYDCLPSTSTDRAFEDSYSATFLVGGCVLILDHVSKVFMHFIICILMHQLFLASLTGLLYVQQC